MLVYLPFCALYAYPLYDVLTTSGAQPQALLARALWELNVLVPTLICVLGLPHRIRPAVASGSMADTGFPPRVPSVVTG